MLDINSVDIEKLQLFLKGVPLEEVFDKNASKKRYVDKRYVAEFLRNERLLDNLRNNLSNYLQVQYIDNLMDLIKYDLNRDERMSASNTFFIPKDEYNLISDKTKNTIRSSNNHFEKLNFIQKHVIGGKGTEITINYDYLLDNIMLSGQSLLRFIKVKNRKSGINKLLDKIKDYKDLNSYLEEQVKQLKEITKNTSKPDFTEEQKNKVLERLYRWTVEYKNKKYKNGNYTVIGDRVYFYYNLKEALSNRDKQILDYLVFTGEIEAVHFSDNSARYAIIKTPSNINIEQEEFEIKQDNSNNYQENKKQAKIQKDLDDILEEKGLLENISDNYYNALLQWSQYVGTRSKNIHYQIPDAISLLERLKVSEDMKIEIINQTRQRSYTTVQYVIDDYAKKGKIDNELKPVKAELHKSNDTDKSTNVLRFEQFKKDNKEEIERLRKSGEDPQFEKFNALKENYYKSKGWV